MKILLIRSEGNQTHINDFMSDLLLHGLRQLYGSEVIDYPGCWYMYSDEIKNKQYDINKIWGKGFTINNTLNNYNSIDRTDIKKKIQEKYFDLIIYSSIRRSDQFLDDVIKVTCAIEKISKTSINFVQKIINQDDIDISSAFCKIVCLNENFKPTKIPDVIADKIV